MRTASQLRPAVAIVAALALGACTWVPMQAGAGAVRVVPAGGTPAGCARLGEIEVTVTDKVGFYERNPLRVQEELETMARNEAIGLGANVVQPVAPPANGSQRYVGWRCG